MANADKFLDDYDDMDDNDLYATKISNKPMVHNKKFRARRKIEELRENKRLQQQIDSYCYD